MGVVMRCLIIAGSLLCDSVRCSTVACQFPMPSAPFRRERLRRLDAGVEGCPADFPLLRNKRQFADLPKAKARNHQTAASSSTPQLLFR
jgi:hypothetical protein